MLSVLNVEQTRLFQKSKDFRNTVGFLIAWETI